MPRNSAANNNSYRNVSPSSVRRKANPSVDRKSQQASTHNDDGDDDDKKSNNTTTRSRSRGGGTHQPSKASKTSPSSASRAQLTAAASAEAEAAAAAQLFRNGDHDGDVGTDEEANNGRGEYAHLNIKRSRFKIPLSLVLVLQVLLAVIVFIIVIAVTRTLVTNITREIVDEKITSDLRLGQTSIYAPINDLNALLSEVRDRSVANIYMRGEQPCHGESPDLEKSQGFLMDAYLATLADRRIGIVYLMKKHNFWRDATTGLPLFAQCSASPNGFRTSHNLVSRLSIGVPPVHELANLSTFPYKSGAALTRFYETAAFREKYLNWMFVLQGNNAAASLWLCGSSPTEYNETNVITGQTETVVASLVTSTELGENPDSSTYSRTVVAALGGCLDLSAFLPMLAEITPVHPLAHTTLYDLTDNLMVTSSIANGDKDFWSFDNSSFSLWKAGHTPHKQLNEAYRDVELQTLAPTELRIREVDNTVVTALGFVLTGGRRVALVQSTPMSLYFNDVDALQNTLIGIGVAGAVLIAVSCIVVGIVIRVGLSKVRDNMLLAAALKNEKVIPTTSFLADVEDLAITLDKMNMKLLLARAFMPQSMLVDSSNDSSNDDDHDGEGGGHDTDEGSISVQTNNGKRHSDVAGGLIDGKPVAGGGRMDSARRRELIFAQMMGDNTYASDGNSVFQVSDATMESDASHMNARNSNTRNNNNFVANPKEQVSAAVGGGSGIQNKRVTIVALNIRRFHRTIVELSIPQSVVQPANDLVDLISKVSSHERGVIDSFHGDHFIISFNAARQNAEGPLKAVRTAMDVMEGVSTQNTIKDRTNNTLFSIGIATGRALVGHLGTNTMKRMSIIGDVYSRAIALERVCRRLPAVVSKNYSTRPQQPHQKIGDNSAGGADSANISLLHSLHPEPIECLVDYPMSLEVQHMCTLQLVAAMNCGVAPTRQMVARMRLAPPPQQNTFMNTVPPVVADAVIEMSATNGNGNTTATTSSHHQSTAALSTLSDRFLLAGDERGVNMGPFMGLKADVLLRTNSEAADLLRRYHSASAVAAAVAASNNNNGNNASDNHVFTKVAARRSSGNSELLDLVSIPAPNAGSDATTARDPTNNKTSASAASTLAPIAIELIHAVRGFSAATAKNNTNNDNNKTMYVAAGGGGAAAAAAAITNATAADDEWLYQITSAQNASALLEINEAVSDYLVLAATLIDARERKNTTNNANTMNHPHHNNNTTNLPRDLYSTPKKLLRAALSELTARVSTASMDVASLEALRHALALAEDADDDAAALDGLSAQFKGVISSNMILF